MDEKLRPCLFCGSANIEIDEEGICCNGCDFWLGFDGYGEYEQLRAEGVKRWNTRPLEDALRTENKRFRDALTQIMRHGDSMTGTPLGTQRQERQIWQAMTHTAATALQAELS